MHCTIILLLYSHHIILHQSKLFILQTINYIHVNVTHHATSLANLHKSFMTEHATIDNALTSLGIINDH